MENSQENRVEQNIARGMLRRYIQDYLRLNRNQELAFLRHLRMEISFRLALLEKVEKDREEIVELNTKMRSD